MRTKGKSDKQGISLIVLVITIIVIIILAVAVILSIANNNPIENAKEARFRNDMKVIEEELNLYIAKEYADSLGTNTGVVDLSGEDMVKALPSTKDYKDKVKIVGGNLELTNSASEEEKEWAKKIGIKAPITFTKTGDLALGSEVTASNGEQFYVIGGDTVGTAISASTQDILLLAKYNLKLENDEITLKQDTSGAASNGCVFSSKNYWSSANYPLDLNSYTVPDGTTSIITKAEVYGNDFGVTGRLMTYEEASILKEKYSNILYGTYTKEGYLNYWLGSANSNDQVWGVFLALAPCTPTFLNEPPLRCPPSYKSLKVFDPISDFRSL